jgi:hypothetical protein
MLIFSESVNHITEELAQQSDRNNHEVLPVPQATS